MGAALLLLEKLSNLFTHGRAFSAEDQQPHQVYFAGVRAAQLQSESTVLSLTILGYSMRVTPWFRVIASLKRSLAWSGYIPTTKSLQRPP